MKEKMGKREDGLAIAGLVIGAIGLVAQLTAPNCPTCGTKLVIINNYCVNCRISWKSSSL